MHVAGFGVAEADAGKDAPAAAVGEALEAFGVEEPEVGVVGTEFVVVYEVGGGEVFREDFGVNDAGADGGEAGA